MSGQRIEECDDTVRYLAELRPLCRQCPPHRDHGASVGWRPAPVTGAPTHSTHTSASKSSIRRFVITEKAPTRALSWLKAATTAVTFKTLLRHYAKRALTPRSLNVKLGPRRNYHKGRAAIRHYAKRTFGWNFLKHY